MTAIQAEIDAGTYMEPAKESLAEWLETWLRIYAQYSVKPYTYDS